MEENQLLRQQVQLLSARLEALEKRVNESRLLMRRPGSDDYERLVDAVVDHEERLNTLE